MSFQFQEFLSKKAEFLITMRATKRFDTILFVPSCLQISEIPVTIKGRIFYHNESNQKSCLHTFLSSHMLMKTHCEPKIILMSGLFLETQVNVVVVTILAKLRGCIHSKFYIALVVDCTICGFFRYFRSNKPEGGRTIARTNLTKNEFL